MFNIRNIYLINYFIQYDIPGIQIYTEELKYIL